MENFDDFEKKSYQSGGRDKYNFMDHLKYHLRMTIITFKILFLSIQERFQNLINPSKMKDIRGQLALVTGKNSYYKIDFVLADLRLNTCFTRFILQKNRDFILRIHHFFFIFVKCGVCKCDCQPIFNAFKTRKKMLLPA